MKVIKINLEDGKFVDVVVENEDAASQLKALLSWYESARKELIDAIDDTRKSGEVDKDRLDTLEAKYG